MSNKQNNRITSTQPPIYIMTPPQKPQNGSSVFDGLGGLAISVLAGLFLGQLGITIPKLPKL